MTVGNEEREVERFAPRTSQKLIAQANDAAPRVQDQRMLSYFDFDTGGIFSIAHRVLSWGWIAAPYSPKTHHKRTRSDHSVPPSTALPRSVDLHLLYLT